MVNNNKKQTCPHCLEESEPVIGWNTCKNCDNKFWTTGEDIISYTTNKLTAIT